VDAIVCVAVDPRDPDARTVLWRYLDEIAGPIGSSTVTGEADDVDEFAAPTGTFLLLRDAGEAIGCGALRTFAPGIGEIKRMWIDPLRRGEGLGVVMLAALEDASRNLGHQRVRLDTKGALTPAIRMYESRAIGRSIATTTTRTPPTSSRSRCAPIDARPRRLPGEQVTGWARCGPRASLARVRGRVLGMREHPTASK